ncbi:MAG: hypothetical protein HKN20_04810 [Gemmatimonadetes bacterium]|nr:hypothetical protein [Gemmatimonadota bacterium]
MSHIEQERLHRYMDGDLSDMETRTVARHLEECADCRNRFHAMRPLDETMRDDHPDPMLLAAYHDGTLDDSATRMIAAHTAACGECRDSLAFLAEDATLEQNTNASGSAERVPEDVSRRAEKLLEPAPANRGFFRSRGGLTALAAAAALVLMIGYWNSDRGGPTLRDGALPERFDRDLAVTPVGDAAIVTGEPVAFAWKAVEGALQYEIEVTGPDGGIIATAKTGETGASLSLPAPVAASYTWRVTAVLRDGSRVVSDYATFVPVTE